MAQSKVSKHNGSLCRYLYNTENIVMYDIAFLSTDPLKYYTMHL